LNRKAEAAYAPPAHGRGNRTHRPVAAAPPRRNRTEPAVTWKWPHPRWTFPAHTCRL